mgnify:CR=1 FL=1
MGKDRKDDDTEKFKEIRKILKLTTEPVAIRQWLYQHLVATIYGHPTQLWPRFSEQFPKKKHR